MSQFFSKYNKYNKQLISLVCLLYNKLKLDLNFNFFPQDELFEFLGPFSKE